MGKLIELSTEELLKKFGSGKHKPGSGSAAAFQGMLSAKLIHTVIDLTKARENYKEWWADLKLMEADLDNRIYPTLENLFQLDSEQFDRVIQLRLALKAESNWTKRRTLKEELDEAMLPATETPISIGKMCVELAWFAIFICDHGFQAARGDSGVALNNLIGTIAGCLSIINLNLLSLGHDEQTEQIRLEAGRLKTAYMDLSIKAMERLNVLEKEAERNKAYHQELQELASGKWAGVKLSYAEIEALARRLQNTLFTYQDKLSKATDPDDVIGLLKPQLVLAKILNYHYEEPESLGQHVVDGEQFEIAGIIDKPNKSVAISRQFSKETRNFTAAHELGHALMHRQPVLHRDKPLDGSAAGITRDAVELEADKFATYFLMPAKQVRRIFRQLFLTDKFVINENTVFSLTGGGVNAFRQKCKSLRGLSRILAEAGSNAGESFKSMAEIFSVSKETMAIRLEELQLVEF